MPVPAPVRVLLVPGSSRAGSTNVAVLRTAAARATPEIRPAFLDGIGSLPLFNPDDDREGAEPHPAVAAMRHAVGRADALMISTPEYAGALPAAMKNLLEWTVGDASTYGKPVAWINAAGPAAPTGAADAHGSLRKVLEYVGADIVAEACTRVPVTREIVGADGLISDEDAAREIGGALRRLAEHARTSRTP